VLQLDLQQIVSQAVSFLVLLWLLRRFAWRPLLTMLDQRRAHIEEELRQAAQRREELARLQAEYSGRLTKIEDEARAKIQQAVLEGKRIAMEIQEQARAQGAAVLEKSKEAIALELAKARVTLRDQLAAMTMQAVEQILRKTLDAEQDRRLVEQALDELERQPPRPS
jgi:F-type H+-transporting ATPase subunit b